MAIIRFYGDLKQFGDKFRMSTETASEALNGLYCQINGLKRHIMNGHFRVRIHGEDMSEKNLQFGLHSKIPENAVIHVIPKIAGAKNTGALSFIAGLVMVVVGAYTNQYWLVGMGMGMMMGGAAEMLAKTPKTEKRDANGEHRNTYFSNLDNSIAQGAVVPVIYGEIMTGSKTLSRGLETIDE